MQRLLRGYFLAGQDHADESPTEEP